MFLPILWFLLLNLKDPMYQNTMELRRSGWLGYLKQMGRVSAHIFAHPKLMVADLNRFVRTEIRRSVCARLRIYREIFPKDLSIEDRMDLIKKYNPPRRVFYKAFPDSAIEFSDFEFANYKQEDVVQMAHKLFAFTVDKEELVRDAETKSKF